MLAVIGLLYGLWAVLSGSTTTLLLESIGIVAFLLLSVLGFRISQWFLVAGLAAHGVYDYFHGHLFTNSGVPARWPMFCLSYDVTAAAYLAGLILLRRARKERPDFSRAGRDTALSGARNAAAFLACPGLTKLMSAPLLSYLFALGAFVVPRAGNEADAVDLLPIRALQRFGNPKDGAKSIAWFRRIPHGSIIARGRNRSTSGHISRPSTHCPASSHARRLRARQRHGGLALESACSLCRRAGPAAQRHP